MTFFGAPGPGLELYHIGLTVPDLGLAMEQYTAAFGFSWAATHESRPEVIVDGERRRAEIAVTYSIQGPPYLELVQERRGSVWGADGLALRVRDAGRDGRPARFSYHPFAGGLWIELVHTSFKAQLADWIADTLAGS
jgi:hypothetical protein